MDIEIEEDLIEEVARMYGYENIPSKELLGNPPPPIDQSLFELIYSLKKTLIDQGFTEVQTYSFFSTKVLNNFDYQKEALVKIANPISAETEYLRNHIWPNLLEVIDKNLRREIEDIAIFEIGKVYKVKDNELPEEKYKLAIALYNNTNNPLPELYQLVKGALENIGIKLSTAKIDPHGSHFHPVRYTRLMVNGEDLGKIGEVHKRITDKFGITNRVGVLEIYLEKLTSAW